jgi:ankyrin repeat protein
MLRFAFAGLCLLAMSAPTVAQFTSASLDFIEAVRSRDGEKVNQLIQAHPTGLVDARDGDGNTPLTITISRSDTDYTAFLLNKGADPNLPGKGGDTPLIAAARVGFEDALDWLLSLGAKVDGTNKMGETALIVAVQQRQALIVRSLLNAGADPDKTDRAAGLSARDYAMRDARSRQILQLIEAKKPKSAASR